MILLVIFTVAFVLIFEFLYFRQAIGKRRAIEDELDKEHSLSPLVLDRIGALAFVFDLSGKILRFNQACENLTGYLLAEVRGKYFWKLFLEPNSSEAMKERLSKLSERPFIKEYESVWLAKGGRRLFIKWSNTLVLDKKARPKYIISVGTDITDYQQKQNVFRGFKRQYQGLIDNIGIGISIISPDLTIAYKNRQFKEWFPRESISDKSVCHDIISNSSSGKCELCPTCKALSEGRSHEVTLEADTLGKNMVCKVSSFPIVDEKGEVAGAIETIQDFTKTKQQEEEIRQSYLAQAVINSLLRFSLENITLEGFLKCALSIIISTPWLSSESKAAIYLVGDESGILTMRAQVNLSEVEVNNLGRIRFGEHLPGLAAQLARPQFSARVYENDEFKSKSTEAYARYCLPILYSGAVLGVMDIYLKKDHLRSKQEEEFLAAIANTLAGVIHRKEVEERLGKINSCFINLGVDPVANIQSFVSLSGEILEASFICYRRIDSAGNSSKIVGEYSSSDSIKTAAKYYAHICQDAVKEQGEILIRDLSKFAKPEENFKFHTFVGQAVKCRGDYVGSLCGFYKELFRPKEDDREFLGIIVSAIGVEEERIRSKSDLDVAYEKVKKAQHELVQSEKLAALGRFSSGMAHEVKNPLAIVLGGIEFLERKLHAEDKDVKVAINKIKESTLRADSVVRNLLKFAMPSEIKTEKIKPKDLINDTLSLIKYRVSLINVKIVTDFTKENVCITGDKNQLQQVLFNLVMNAVEAVPRGGSIRIKTLKAAAGEFLAVPACIIEVSDTGEGIIEEDLAKLFEPFFTTKRNKKGTGLGLSISKIIVENHKGQLTIDSESKKGTTAKIILPIVSPEVTRP